MRAWLRVVAVLVTPVVLGGAAARPAPLPPVAPLVQTWVDEFGGVAGSRPGPWWRVEVVDCCGTEQQSYIDSRDTSALDGQGHLVITAIRRTSPTGRDYVSARLSNGFSDRPYYTAFGRWAVRMWLPSGQGLFPAFWGLGPWQREGDWPRNGELDVVEAAGSMMQVHGGIHTVDGAGAHWHTGGAFANPAGGSWAGAWHVFSVAWSDRAITWYADGVAWQTVTRAQVEAAGGRWLDANRPQAPIVNLAVGGDFAGPAAGWDSARLLVDWVRLYLPRPTWQPQPSTSRR